MKRMMNVVAVTAIAGVSFIAPLPAVGDNQSASRVAQQPAPTGVPQSAGGSRGAMPPDYETRGQWRSEFDDQPPESGYTEWGTAPPSGEWGEPVYGGWSPEPSGTGWGSESSAAGEEEGAPPQWATPRSPSMASPEQNGSEKPGASVTDQPWVDPWATTDRGTETPPAGQAAEPPSAPRTESSPASGQPAGTANYPAQPPLAPPRAPPMAYGGYPGYGAGAVPPPPPGWGYGYPGYGAPPGPYGGPGRGHSGGWPWGDIIPWGNRGGGNSPWGNWMPWSK